jgi:hypothetical protein
MAHVVFTCPFCSAEEMTGDRSGYFVAPAEFCAAQGTRPFAIFHTHCRRCWNPIAIKVLHPNSTGPQHHQGFLLGFAQALDRPAELSVVGYSYSVVTAPNRTDNIPPHLSDEVRKAFTSAERNAEMEDGEDAAAMLYRRAIDVATKQKYPDYKGMLAERIGKLAEEGILPSPMKDWADHIRWIGNDGAHEPAGVTKDEVRSMKGFADAFLRYLVSMPFEVNFARGKIDKDGNPIVLGTDGAN